MKTMKTKQKKKNKQTKKETKKISETHSEQVENTVSGGCNPLFGCQGTLLE